MLCIDDKTKQKQNIHYKSLNAYVVIKGSQNYKLSQMLGFDKLLDTVKGNKAL